MSKVLIIDETLASPTVGTFTPAIGIGAPLTVGLVIGSIVKAGRSVQLIAPAGVGGVAVDVISAGTWVACGDVLVRAGDGTVEGSLAPKADDREADVPEGVTVIRADTDGTVYLRADPVSPVFAAVGATVAANATLALVEVMKTFSPVRAPIGGSITRVCVQDSSSVEAGEPLFWLSPEA